jgi:uncharacterized protein
MFRILVVLVVMMLVGCESMPISLMKPSVDEQGAQSLYDEGRFQEAANAYSKLAKYDRKQRTRYQLLSAQAHREDGALDAAKKALKGIKRTQLANNDALLLDLLDAELMLRDGNADGALSLLVADPKKLPPDLAARYHELRAQAFEQKSDYADALRERVNLGSYLDAVEKAANEHDAKKLLAKLSPEDQRNLLRATDRKDPLYDFLVRAGGFAREATTGSFTDAVSGQPSSTSQTSLGNLQRDSVRKIALLLPNSGPFAPAAKAVQDGVMAAYFADQGARPDIVFYDTGATPSSALASYQRALAEGADRIIGPLQRDQVTALFRDNMAVAPTIALNFAELPVLPPKGSLQYALLPEEEAVSAASYMFERGLKTVGLLTSDDDFGKRAADAFASRFQALGGQIAESAQYSSTGTSYGEAIRRAVGINESQQRIAMVRSIVGIPFTSEATRRYDINGLFLAARPAQARLIVPQLRAFDAEDWPIVATSAVYAGIIAAGADRDLNGVAFCDVPWLLNAADQSVPPRSQVASLQSSVGSGGRLFAFGMDAYRLANYLGALEANPGTAIPGATGKLSADSNGSVRRQPTWAVMSGGVASATQ